MDRRAALAAVASVLVVVCSARAARAHSGGTRYALMAPAADAIALDVSMDATEVAAAAGLGSAIDPGELAGARAEIVTRLLEDGLTVTVGGERCTSSAGTLGTIERDGVPMVTLPMRFACTGSGALSVSDTSLAPGTTARTFVAMDGPDGRTTQLLAPGSSSATLAVPSVAATARTFTVEGMRHLVTGYDHLLFVLSLLLGAGLRARERGLRTALRETAVVVTSFTIGHSITLAAAALGLVPFSSRLVEAAIAASIVAVAALNVLRPDHAEGRPWLALAFGMIHGFGFSSVLAEVGLPRGRHLVALVSFNVGIELAQLAFVTLVLVPLAWAARHRLYRGLVMQAGSAVIAVCGAVWLWQRLTA